FLVSTTTLGLGLADNGLLTRDLGIASLAATIPAFLGLFAGLRLRRRIPEDQFRRILLGALLVLGVYMGINALA
ncbi:MAG: sulfite exporter TauE/SafE family protein, partial [Alphaproteobacteria bacterium]